MEEAQREVDGELKELWHKYVSACRDNIVIGGDKLPKILDEEGITGNTERAEIMDEFIGLYESIGLTILVDISTVRRVLHMSKKRKSKYGNRGIVKQNTIEIPLTSQEKSAYFDLLKDKLKKSLTIIEKNKQKDPNFVPIPDNPIELRLSTLKESCIGSSNVSVPIVKEWIPTRGRRKRRLSDLIQKYGWLSK